MGGWESAHRAMWRWERQRLPLLRCTHARSACTHPPRTRHIPPTTFPQVLDTCADSDCGGCCSRNAREAGSGVLLDLEYHTAKRFWGGQVVDSATIQWQVV